jgi:hypothetical protein
VVLTYISALVGVVRKVVTSVRGYEEDMILIVSDNSAYSLNYTHFNNTLYLRYISNR